MGEKTGIGSVVVGQKSSVYVISPSECGDSALVAVREQYCLPSVSGDPIVTFEVICKNTAFLCNCAFCGASRDCCTKNFDVTQNGHFEHLEITTFLRECSSPSEFIGLLFGSSIFTWGIFYLGLFNNDNVGVGCWIIMG